MATTQEIILANYEAYRRGDIDAVIAGWHPAGELKPLTQPGPFKGRDEIRRFFTEEIDRLSESNFRIDVVLAKKEHALVLGRYRRNMNDKVMDTSIFWVARVEDEMMAAYEAFSNVREAFEEFNSRTEASDQQGERTAH
jgi:ketosteroid isomerase-like protein